MADMAITPDQCRAARALLKMSQDALCEAAGGLSRGTLIYFEAGTRAASEDTVAALEKALVRAGVEFIPENGGGAGVRMKRRAKK